MSIHDRVIPESTLYHYSKDEWIHVIIIYSLIWADTSLTKHKGNYYAERIYTELWFVRKNKMVFYVDQSKLIVV